MIASYRGHETENLPSPEEAIARFGAAVSLSRPTLETVALDAARDRVLAYDLFSEFALPAQTRSAMDGYALRCEDLASTPSLRTLGKARAGKLTTRPIRRGEAVRVVTGGLMPPGSNTVVPIEHAVRSTAGVTFTRPPNRGDHVIEIGSDVAARERVLECGRRLRSSDLGVLAAFGHQDVAVLRRPIVGVLSTGNEVVAPGASRRAWEVYDVNRFTIRAALVAWGAQVIPIPHVLDDSAALIDAIKTALPHCDAIVLSGGSSIGEHDVTAAALKRLEPPGIVVHGVRMKPGRPVILASAGPKPIIGLPGNPTAALLVLMVLGQPIVRALTGQQSSDYLGRFSVTEVIHGKPGWDCFVPVSLRLGGCIPLPLCAANVSTFARADGYVRVPAALGVIPAGNLTTVHPLP